LALIDQVFGPGKGRPEAPPAPAPVARAIPPAAMERSERPVRPERPEREAPVAGSAPPDDRSVVECVRGFLQPAFEQGASDIHLEARREELAVRFRVHGALHEYTRLPGPWAKPTIACLKALAHIGSKTEDETDPSETSAAREGSIPFVFRKANYEVRIATLPT